MTDTADFVRRYLTAVSDGATGPRLAAFFDPEVVQEKLPNRLNPAGVSRDLAGILDAAEAGKKAMRKQRFDVTALMAGGNRVAIEATWTGTLAAALGSVAAGAEIKARLAIFIEMKDGRILRQRNYDCFEPF